MTRSRVSLRGSQPGSGESEDDSSDAKSVKEEATPLKRRKFQDPVDAMDTNA